ncbi:MULTISPECIES: RNA polymerase sigma-70 factor [Flavobacteriaceae]|uniref:RNA polymerase sigma-70 factor n=1 Tax=Flavobacteriaceae TaxID=49546 RepID=UPI001490BA21|nr:MULTISPECIES: RNA polymerase sigma-70 factor [Allomuricauda]MDC6367617.1 RNA polymerase sigma-70 factor [Muricauda sp. AC10]
MGEVDYKLLLKELKNSNEAAFKNLFQDYCPKVKSFLISVNLKKDLEDVIQETFITVWNKRETIDLEKSFDSYLFTIAKNYALKTLRKQVFVELQTPEIKIEEDSQNPENGLDLAFYNKTISSSLDRLPPKSKEVFKMRRYEGMSTKQVAEKLGIAPKTVENYMNTALSKLRKDLEHLTPLIVFFLLP